VYTFGEGYDYDIKKRKKFCYEMEFDFGKLPCYENLTVGRV